MQNIFRDFHDKQSYPNGIILSDKIMVKEVKDYQKTSPSTAQATIIYYASFDFVGVPAVFLGQNIVSLDMAYSGSADSLKTGEAFNAVFDEVSVTYNLAKTSAGWKISSIKPDYSYPNGTIEPKAENQEGGETDGSSSAN